MDPSKVSIIRSRTTQSRVTADRARTKPYSFLREISKELPVTSYDNLPKGKSKKVKTVSGARYGRLGGGDLYTSTSSYSIGDRTRTIGQNCYPQSSEKPQQATACDRCGDGHHKTASCTVKHDTLSPTNLFCKQCTIKSNTYTSNTQQSIEIILCPSHKREKVVLVLPTDSLQTNKTKNAAKVIVNHVEQLVDCGVSVADACNSMKITAEEFSELKKLIE